MVITQDLFFYTPVKSDPLILKQEYNSVKLAVLKKQGQFWNS